MSVMLATKEKIELIAQNYLEEFFGGGLIQNGELPINVNKVAQILGVSVKYVNYKDPHIAKTVSGSFVRSRNLILVNANEIGYRRRFTLAHELGHFALHKDIDGDILYRSDNIIDSDGLDQESKDREVEANCFAAALLMPRQVVNLLNDLNFKVEEMARMFDVSPSAMQYRLINLGYAKK
jgi:Zn-dependent peptidase ImmA (M78 family)